MAKKYFTQQELEKLSGEELKSATRQNIQVKDGFVAEMMNNIEAIATPEDMAKFPTKETTGISGDIIKLSAAFSILAKRIHQMETDQVKDLLKTARPKKTPKVE